jgi:hypothetical protein
MADRKLPEIRPGDALFLSDGASAFGAVRDLRAGDPPALLVNVEGAGDFRVPLDAVDRVVGRKVILRWHELDGEIQEAIKHATDREDFPPPGEEVELVPPPTGEEEDDSFAPDWIGPHQESPLDELPGRDVGSRYGAPPSTTVPRRR